VALVMMVASDVPSWEMASRSRFGDGKPIILVPQYLGSDLGLLPLLIWLKALGYRRGRVSDIIVLAPPHGTTTTDDIRIHFIYHFISHGWSMLHSMMELPRLLAKIGIELIELSELSELEVALGAPAEEEAK